jgi:hypothetical protein
MHGHLIQPPNREPIQPVTYRVLYETVSSHSVTNNVRLSITTGPGDTAPAAWPHRRTDGADRGRRHHRRERPERGDPADRCGCLDPVVRPASAIRLRISTPARAQASSFSGRSPLTPIDPSRLPSLSRIRTPPRETPRGPPTWRPGPRKRPRRGWRAALAAPPCPVRRHPQAFAWAICGRSILEPSSRLTTMGDRVHLRKICPRPRCGARSPDRRLRG